jgi:hypothetical protein
MVPVPKEAHQLPRDLSTDQIHEIGLRARLEAAEARAALQRVLAEYRQALELANRIAAFRL